LSRTHHITPKGIPHGLPEQWSAVLVGTEGVAVMVDTFRPLMVTKEAMGLDDGQYYKRDSPFASNEAPRQVDRRQLITLLRYQAKDRLCPAVRYIFVFLKKKTPRMPPLPSEQKLKFIETFRLHQLNDKLTQKNDMSKK
jgi:hypothetical protein